MDFFGQIPLWGVFLLTVVVVALGFEVGYRAGLFEKSKQKGEEKAPVGAMVGVMLSLSAFILAFTFGVAADRFNERRVLVIEEANAIGTTYLRCDFLPDKNRDEMKRLLREYVGLRLRVSYEHNRTHDQNLVLQAAEQSEKLQDLMWAQAVEVGKSKLDSDVIALFIDSLNQTIDLQSKRVTAALYARLPGPVWLNLYLLMFFGMAGLGYEFGFAGQRKVAVTCIALLSFAIVMTMIADLDRPTEGFMQASKQPLIDLGKKFGFTSEGLQTK
jgi:hypothetical protein